MQIKAIIYDFDGPINDSYMDGLRRIRRLCAVHEIPFGREQRKEIIKLWGAYGPVVLEKGLGISKEAAVAMYPEWERLDLEEPVPLVVGARQVLYWGQQNGIRNCLLTSRNSKNIDDILKRIDVHRYFDIMSCKDQQTYSKPDPRAFYYVEQELQEQFGITREECVFVGDTETDVQAGHAAGYETLIVMTGPYTLQSGEHTIAMTNLLRSVDDLPLWIEGHHDGELPVFYSG